MICGWIVHVSGTPTLLRSRHISTCNFSKEGALSRSKVNHFQLLFIYSDPSLELIVNENVLELIIHSSVYWNSISAVSEILRPPCPASTITLYSKSLWFPCVWLNTRYSFFNEEKENWLTAKEFSVDLVSWKVGFESVSKSFEDYDFLISTRHEAAIETENHLVVGIFMNYMFIWVWH